MSKGAWKKILSLLAAVVFTFSLLAGCGGKTSGPAQSEQAAAETKNQEGTAKAEEEKPAEPEGKITLWSWEEGNLKKIVPEFNKVYPKITVENTPVQANDYLKKVQTSVAAGMELPDILFAEIGFRGKIFALDIWEDLEQAPYNFDRSSVFPYLIPLMSNPEGKIIGIDWTVCPSGLAYNRDAAKKYLGTDDPKEIQAMIPDWETFITKGKEVSQNSGGKAFMLTGMGDLTTVLLGQDPTPMVEGNAINATAAFGKVLDLATKIRDAGIIDKLEMWSPAWNASYAAGNHIFYPCATWSPSFVIEPNDKEGKDRWGLITPPGGGFSWGGTTWGISNTSKNKEQAWTFIQWNLLTSEGAKVNKELINYPSSFKGAYEDPAYAGLKTPSFGDQDIGNVFFNDIAPAMKVRPITKDDASIMEVFYLVQSALVKDSKVTGEVALARMKDELKKKLPEMDAK